MFVTSVVMKRSNSRNKLFTIHIAPYQMTLIEYDVISKRDSIKYKF